MEAFTGPCVVACALLALAGAGKLRAPTHAQVALRTVGLPSSVPFVRLVGAAELALAGVAFATAGAAALAALAGAYTAFALFIIALLRKGERRISCGCFGTRDIGITALHALLNGGFALSLLLATVFGASGAPAIAAEGVRGGWLLAICAVGTYAAWLAFTRGAEVFAHRTFVRASRTRSVVIHQPN